MGRLKHSIMVDSVNEVKALLNDTKYNFVAIGYYLRKIDDDKLYRESGHDNIWDFAKEQFGLSKSSASRFMSINKRFSIGGYSDRLADSYQQFSVSQMSEMLTLTDEQINQIDSTTTIREIRDMKPKQEKKQEPMEGLIEGQMTLEDYPEVVPEQEVVAMPQQDEKNIPKRPDIRGIMDAPYCPNCDCELHYKKELTCPWCNQAIDWDSVKKFFEKDEENTTLEQSEVDNDEVLRHSHIANKYYLQGDYESADFYLYHARKTLNEEKEFEKVNIPDINEFARKIQALPVLKNNDQRGEFIDNFESWTLWIDCQETGEKIYRYELEEGIALAVREKLRHKWILGKYKYSKTDTEYAGFEYYLIGVDFRYGVKGSEFKKSDSKTFHESLTNRSCLIEFLKKYQKGEVQ